MEESIEFNQTKKKFLNISRVFAYFIIYSVLGYIIETIFAFIMYGVIESRQSFMYGPFCAIYGVGAVSMIISLHFFDKNNYYLFAAGCVVGSIVEYIISWVGELWLHTRWWDYSDKFLNLNGRICFVYSLFWGALAIYLMRTINPRVDKIIDWVEGKIGKKAFKITISIVVIFMFVDCLYSAAAEEWVLTKVCVEKNLDVENKEILIQNYEKINNNKAKKEFVDRFWSIKKVLYAYPNLTKELRDGRRVYIKRLYPEIHPYYLRVKPEKKGTIYEK